MKNLQELLSQKEVEFESIRKEIQKRGEEISELENELCRIQGEYRLISRFIEEEQLKNETAEGIEAEIVE